MLLFLRKSGGWVGVGLRIGLDLHVCVFYVMECLANGVGLDRMDFVSCSQRLDEHDLKQVELSLLE